MLRDSIRVLCTADHGDDPDLVGAWCANKTPGQVAEWIADPEGHLFVAELDGRLAGVAGLRRAEAAGLAAPSAGELFFGYHEQLMKAVARVDRFAPHQGGRE